MIPTRAQRDPVAPRRFLVVYDLPPGAEKGRHTLLDHVHLMEHSEATHSIEYYDVRCDLADWTKANDSDPLRRSDFLGGRFDAVILHYSFLGNRAMGLPFYRWKRQYAWISEFECLKIAMPHDEGCCASVLDEWLFELGVDVVFSIHYAADRPLYQIMRRHARILPCFPGYISERVAQRCRPLHVPLSERPNDIVYRARDVPFWVGSSGRVKTEIADIVGQAADARGLACNISTRYEDTVFGWEWFRFLASGKATLGVEGGYTAIDWRGEVCALLQARTRAKPDLTFEEFEAVMPPGWDSHDLLTLTPRHLEAILTKTCQILREGAYRGVLEPYRHYIPLCRDWSNLSEALDMLEDSATAQAMVDRAYDEVYRHGHYTYADFARRIDELLVQNSDDEDLPVKSEVDESGDVVAALERQLIAERHQGALLHHRLTEFQLDMPRVVHEAVGNATASTVVQCVQMSVQQAVGPCVTASEANVDTSRRLLRYVKLLSLLVAVLAVLTAAVLVIALVRLA